MFAGQFTSNSEKIYRRIGFNTCIIIRIRRSTRDLENVELLIFPRGLPSYSRYALVIWWAVS